MAGVKNVINLVGSLTVALCVQLSGCAGGYDVRSSVEDDGTIIDRTVDNELGVEGAGDYADYAIPDTDIHAPAVDMVFLLDAARHRAADGSTTYILLFSYTGSQPLSIENRRSLEIVIDDLPPIVLRGQGQVDRREDTLNETHTESFDYLITIDTLVMLSRAREATVTVTGSEFELRGFFREANFATYRKFVDDYVDDYVDWQE